MPLGESRKSQRTTGQFPAPFALAQSSNPVPATAAPRVQSATEGPRSPAFEYLGTLRAETGTRTVVENGLTKIIAEALKLASPEE